MAHPAWHSTLASAPGPLDSGVRGQRCHGHGTSGLAAPSRPCRVSAAAAVHTSGHIWAKLGSPAYRAPAGCDQPHTTLEPAGSAEYIAEALEYRPALSPLQDIFCLAVAAAPCVPACAAALPTGLDFACAAVLLLLYGGLVALTRSWLLEQQFKALQRSEKDMACRDSKFLPVEGIELHYRCSQPRRPSHFGRFTPTVANLASASALTAESQPAGPTRRVVHCLHGFGASAFSWSFVQDELAQQLGAVVTAHDMPGFGLTERPSAHHYYTLGFNSAAARAVMDAELASLPCSRQGDRAQRVLVGHSMGGAAVAEAVIANPEGISAIVLVAPDIVACWPEAPQQAQRDSMAAVLALVEQVVGAKDAPDVLNGSDWEALGRCCAECDDGVHNSGHGGSPGAPHAAAAVAASHSTDTGAHTAGVSSAAGHGHPEPCVPPLLRLPVPSAVAQAATCALARGVLWVADPLVVLLLRQLVRSRSFWERGLASVWVQKSKVSRAVVDGYRSAQLVRGWERGLLNFLAGRLAEKQSLWEALCPLKGCRQLSQVERLAQVVEQHGIRVLILHGADDVIVPAAKSRLLACLLPGACLVELEACGHMLQEEAPDRFVREVAEFLAESR